MPRSDGKSTDSFTLSAAFRKTSPSARTDSADVTPLSHRFVFWSMTTPCAGGTAASAGRVVHSKQTGGTLVDPARIK